jgi:hypothetical protein
LSAPLRRAILFCALVLSIAPCVRASEPPRAAVVARDELGNADLSEPPPAAVVARDELEEADLQERWQSLKAAAVLCWRNDFTCFDKIQDAIALDQTLARTLAIPPPPDAPKTLPVALAFDGMYAYPRDAWAFATLRLVVKKGKCDAGTWQLPNRTKTQAVRALPAAPEVLLRLASAEVAREAWPQDWDEFKNKIEPAILDCAARHK